MTTTPPASLPVPSRWLRAAAVVASRLLGLMLGVWLLFGILWGALHWIIVPRIGDFRPQLETQASKALGVQVSIGSIQAQTHGMIPSFELGDVKLLDAQGNAALWLPKVMVALSPQSLVGLGFEQIYIDRPELSIKRSKDGKITIAGLDFSSKDKGDGSALDWFFSQREFVVRHGKVQWTDELRDLPPLALSDVDLVTRNRYRKHELRLDASLPASMGTRLSAMGKFNQRLLSLNSGKWQEWDGQIYTAFDSVDVAALDLYAGTQLEVAQGQGGLRAWADVSKGRITTATADVTLANMNVTLAKPLQPLTLKTVQGRLGGSLLPDGFEFFTQGLQFETQDGLRWPGGNVRVNYSGASILGSPSAAQAPSSSVPATASIPGPKPTVNRGSIKADKLDLAALSQIANRLPLGERAQAAIAAWAPKGIVETLDASWQGQSTGGDKYQARGRVVGFEIAPINFAAPSVRGLTADFDVTQAGGKASIAIANGAVNLPGVFDDPLVPLVQLSGDAQWTVTGERIAVQLPNLKFSNADAQGEAQLKWQTLDVSAGSTRSRFPGVLDLQGNLSRLEGTRVHRYLPSLMRANAREYVREAIQQGLATNVKFKAKGNIYEMPFADPKLGEFSISAKMNDAVFAYVPQSMVQAGSRSWPALTEVNGELLIDRLKLQVKGVTGRVGGSTTTGKGLQITKADGQIADLQNAPTVVVSAEARGAASEVLALVNSSPLGELISGALAKSTATGNADVKLKLNLPIAAIDKTTVQGSVSLAGSDFQFSPATPPLLAARGVLNFSERGFSLANLQGRMFGGDIALEGGSQVSPAAQTPSRSAAVVQATREQPGIVLRAKGTMTAEALRQMKDLGFISRLAQQATGSAAYSAVLGFRNGVPELQFSSDLVGLALNLPAPLAKSAESALAIKFENAPIFERGALGLVDKVSALDQLKLDVGRIASLSYVRDVSGADAKVLRGTMAVGLATDESAPMPAEGVVANINMARLDLDAWAAVLTQATGVQLTVPEPGQSPTSSTTASAAAAEPNAQATAANAETVPRPRGAANPALGYLPNSMAIRAGELLVGGRRLTNLVVGGSREGLTWRANLDASELNGYAEYRQPAGSGAGRVYARLARVTLAQASAKDVESLLDEQPSSIPALDIIIDDLELRGKKLGRLEIEAINRGAGAVAREGGVREWRLAKFNVTTPEASFTATGNWAAINAQSPGGVTDLSRPDSERRRTVMNFKLDIEDAGDLLARFGMKDVFRRGKGKLEGQVAWAGSPITPDYPSMAGAFTVNMERGQFLKADPGLAKLLGVLSLQSLPRRLALDFRDVFTDGFSFDFVRGDVKIDQGIASTNNLQMKGVNAAVLMDGQADISKETQKIRVIVVPEINAGTASLIAAAINPAIGLGTFLAQVFLRGPLIEAATQEFLIDGTWVDPQVTPVKRKTQTGGATPNEVTR